MIQEPKKTKKRTAKKKAKKDVLPEDLPLTNKQRVFVEEYLVDLNGTQAAIRAGYSKKTAGEMAYENLNKPHIQKYIVAKFAERSQKTGLNAQYIIDHLMELVQRCMVKVPVMEWNYEERKLEQAIDPKTGEGVWSFDSAGANKALRNLGEHLGMFKNVHANDKENPLFPAVNITVVNPAQDDDFDDC